ncbi:MAG: pitrilysin family protein [Vampirovibrionales bacterium]|nr:pitrilysin family protein [Vampirovibrionales bacterium]
MIRQTALGKMVLSNILAASVAIIPAAIGSVLSISLVSSTASAQSTAPAQAVTPINDEASTDIFEYTLPTGQKLYVKPDHTKPIVTIDTWVKTGSVNETNNINGVSHFLEHLLFKGTTHYKPGDIERILESKGAEFNAQTSDDFTHYYITTASPYFEEALGLHADMMLNANLPKDELSRERAVVQEEINRALDNPQRQVYITLSKLMYGDHGYGLDTLGPKSVIASVPRNDILDYYHYWYQPQHFATVIVGDVDPEKVKAMVSQYFPAPAYQRPEKYEAPMVEMPVAPAKALGEVSLSPNVTQAYYTLSFLGPSIKQAHDSYALDIAMKVLGDGKSSRLYRRLVEEKPLALGVSAVNMTQKYSGLLNIDAKMQVANRDEVKNIILDELNTMLLKGVTAEELAKAKTQVLKDFVFLNETTDGVAQTIGYNVTIGTLKDYTDYVAEIQKITLDDVKEAVRKYLQFDKAVVVEMLPSKGDFNTAAENEQNLALLETARENYIASLNKHQQQDKIAEAAKTDISQSPGQPSAQPENQSSKAVINAVEKITLPNGMTVLLKENPDSETVALKLFVKGGQLQEPIPGVAQLTSQMLLQGTDSRSAEEISQELESRGMSLNVSASEDFLEVSGDAMKDDLGELMIVLQDVLNHSQYSQEELAKQKELLKQSILSSRDNPSAIAFENLSLNLYPDHPYGNVGKRIEDHLNMIQPETVRTFAQKNLTPDNTLAVVVGNFDAQAIKPYLSTLYGATSNNTPQESKTAVTLPKVKSIPENEEILESKDKQAATWVAKGWLVPPVKNPDHVPLKVLNSLLGSGMSSRLFVNLREKQGLAYVVSSYYPSRKLDSRFVLYIGTDPKNFTQVEKGFSKEINRLKSERVSAVELQDAKDKLAGNFALAHETNASQAYYLGLFEVLGVGYQFDAQFPEMVQEVQATDIQRVAQKYFSQPSVTSIVKPKDFKLKDQQKRQKSS